MLIFIARLPQLDQATDQTFTNIDTEIFPDNHEGRKELRKKVDDYLADLTKSECYGEPDHNDFYFRKQFKSTGRATWKHGAFVQVERMKINF